MLSVNQIVTVFGGRFEEPTKVRILGFKKDLVNVRLLEQSGIFGAGHLTWVVRERIIEESDFIKEVARLKLFTLGQKVRVYDRARFGFPVKAEVVDFNEFSVNVLLLEAAGECRTGSTTWVFKQQVRHCEDVQEAPLSKAITEVIFERKRQGVETDIHILDDRRNPASWCDKLRSYLDKVAYEALRGSLTEYRRKLSHVAVLAIAACESFDKVKPPSEDEMKCNECGQMFDPRNLSDVGKHLHLKGPTFRLTAEIKGHPVGKKYTPKESTSISEIYYNRAERTFEVVFRATGNRAHYLNVPPEVFEKAFFSDNIEVFIIIEVADKYRRRNAI